MYRFYLISRVRGNARLAKATPFRVYLEIVLETSRTTSFPPLSRRFNAPAAPSPEHSILRFLLRPVSLTFCWLLHGGTEPETQKIFLLRGTMAECGCFLAIEVADEVAFLFESLTFPVSAFISARPPAPSCPVRRASRTQFLGES